MSSCVLFLLSDLAMSLVPAAVAPLSSHAPVVHTCHAYPVRTPGPVVSGLAVATAKIDFSLLDDLLFEESDVAPTAEELLRVSLIISSFSRVVQGSPFPRMDFPAGPSVVTSGMSITASVAFPSTVLSFVPPGLELFASLASAACVAFQVAHALRGVAIPDAAVIRDWVVVLDRLFVRWPRYSFESVPNIGGLLAQRLLVNGHAQHAIVQLMLSSGWTGSDDPIEHALLEPHSAEKAFPTVVACASCKSAGAACVVGYSVSSCLRCTRLCVADCVFSTVRFPTRFVDSRSTISQVSAAHGAWGAVVLERPLRPGDVVASGEHAAPTLLRVHGSFAEGMPALPGGVDESELLRLEYTV